MKKTLMIMVFIFSSVFSLILSAEDQWLSNFEVAKKQAAKKKVPILVDFTGSDWCGWCVKLKKEVFSKEAFKNYAEKNLVLLKLDFPRNKKLPEETRNQNIKLMQKYGVRAFPTILILDSKGKVLGKTGYKAGGADNYIKHIKSILKK